MAMHAVCHMYHPDVLGEVPSPQGVPMYCLCAHRHVTDYLTKVSCCTAAAAFTQTAYCSWEGGVRRPECCVGGDQGGKGHSKVYIAWRQGACRTQALHARDTSGLAPVASAAMSAASQQCKHSCASPMPRGALHQK